MSRKDVRIAGSPDEGFDGGHVSHLRPGELYVADVADCPRAWRDGLIGLEQDRSRIVDVPLTPAPLNVDQTDFDDFTALRPCRLEVQHTHQHSRSLAFRTAGVYRGLATLSVG